MGNPISSQSQSINPISSHQYMDQDRYEENDNIHNFKKKKLESFRHEQNNRNWPDFNSNPVVVGRIKSRGLNNDNQVFQGPYGGLFYYSRASGTAYSVKPSQKVDFS